MEPFIIHYSANKKKEFYGFIQKYKQKGFKIYDFYRQFITQLYLVQTPSAYFSNEKESLGNQFYIDHIRNKEEFLLGNWVILPWNKEIYHLPEKKDLLKLRTVRNRGLLSWVEQLKIYNKRIALVGLSVGSALLMSLIRSGVGNYYRICDFDIVDPHNINRAPFFLRDVGVAKIEVITNQMLSVDPYLKVDIWKKAIERDNIKDFLKNVDLLIDCFDNFEVKLLLKKEAKRSKIPILSGFNISRGAMVITERYDLDQNLDLGFYLNGFSESDIFKPILKPQDKTDLFVNIIGRENHDDKMLKAVYKVGKELSGYPQLMVGTSAIATMWTIAAIDILLGRDVESIRSYIDFEKAIYKD